ncbi:sodium-dependent transporter [Pseudemcibacter aquimaris]|uniref:sodium-dependent transporter n=1 Tax=Pseudemcibacter aquimaris TaxID=2857064 RepID=UPI002010F2B7|nr:sodium-dependent transporter [Pseudemcibacter aquimaris]MCC3860560.1 sodium-dependent transporter [Pseudemcibacter aquimaris]WDU59383.1 sodium-dependent transporter [Pseudemcibacter aquimaris]
MQSQSSTPRWSSEYAFVLAAVGAAVGLGNIWRFPYLAGQSGGGAFVIVYLLFVIALGIPLVMGELALGRQGGKSPVATMEDLQKKGHHPFWKSIGWVSVCLPLVTMGFYTVVTGWILDFIVRTLMGSFNNINADQSTEYFSVLQNSWAYMLSLNTGFMIILGIVVALGVKKGLETTVRIMMPALFAILVLMAIYSLATGDAGAALTFLFEPDFSKITFRVLIDALGQALFSLAIGAGALITYGAYLPQDVNIPKTAKVIAVSDTLVAIFAGLAIFPIVFQYGLEPSEGAGLIFVSLPIAFGQMTGGIIIGSLFFILLIFASFTSGISMIEPIVSVLEGKGLSRKKGVILVSSFCWFLSMLAALSFNILQDERPLGFIPFLAEMNIFDTLNFLVSAIILPFNAMIIAIFIGWLLSRKTLLEQFGYKETDMGWKLWSFSMKLLSPIACAFILLNVFFA